MFRSSIDFYCHKVKKALICDRSTEKVLIDGLRSELCDRFSEDSSYEKLVAEYGSPSDIAAELQEAVPVSEHQTAFQKRKRFLSVVAALIIFTCIGVTAKYLHDVANSRLVSKQETIIIDGTIPTNLPDIEYVEEDD